MQARCGPAGRSAGPQVDRLVNLLMAYTGWVEHSWQHGVERIVLGPGLSTRPDLQRPAALGALLRNALLHPGVHEHADT